MSEKKSHMVSRDEEKDSVDAQMLLTIILLLSGIILLVFSSAFFILEAGEASNAQVVGYGLTQYQPSLFVPMVGVIFMIAGSLIFVLRKIIRRCPRNESDLTSIHP